MFMFNYTSKYYINNNTVWIVYEYGWIGFTEMVYT